MTKHCEQGPVVCFIVFETEQSRPLDQLCIGLGMELKPSIGFVVLVDCSYYSCHQLFGRFLSIFALGAFVEKVWMSEKPRCCT